MASIIVALASCTVLALIVGASDTPPRPSVHREGVGKAHDDSDHRYTAGDATDVGRLIKNTGSNVSHVDLTSREGGLGPGGSSNQEGSVGGQPPWFEYDAVAGSESSVVTIGHPIRRVLSFLREEGIELETSLSWVEGQGIAVNATTHPRRGYQLVDNYLVRVLAGESAWGLPPGGVGPAELLAARVVLGKFEVLLREDCLAFDLSLLRPYLKTAENALDIPSAEGDRDGQPAEYLLPAGAAGQSLVRLNRWDLQLWNFANSLVVSRSATYESYMCGSSRLKRNQNTLGSGRRAVVYNSPDFHLTGVSMFSCMLMSWGFHVTAVLKTPGQGFEQLLPCAHEVVPLQDHPATTFGEYRGRDRIVLNSSALAVLGLEPDTQPRSGNGDLDGAGEVGVVENPGPERGGGAFDVSVLCTVYRDLNILLDPRHIEMDPRLADALLWNVNTTIWNTHGVSRAFDDGGVPPSAHDFAARVPTGRGMKPPPTFLTVYGEHVKRWEASLEEAYEGWETETVSQTTEGKRKKQANLRGLFPLPGVVYPIVPTGSMRLLRPKSGLIASENSGTNSRQEAATLGDIRRVNFVVQGNMFGVRRDYKSLFGCLEAMCSAGRENFSVDAVGSYGNVTEVLEAHPCTQARYTEGRDLEYNNFYARINAGDFVVTATAGDSYEYNRATSSVPTALLLERPLVMSSSLLDAYPCLKNSRIHSSVANDDLCLNLQAAYDLTQREYDEMELEARDCKLDMWKQSRKTVGELVMKGRVDNCGS